MNLNGIDSQAGAIAAQSFESEELPRESESHEAAGKKFEALIATMLVKEMRKALPGGFFGSGPGADTFGGWLDKSIGDSLADGWNLDIAGMVKTNLDAKQARLDLQQTTQGELDS